MQCHTYTILALHTEIGVGVAMEGHHTLLRAPAFLILCAQERAVRRTHLVLSCTQPAPLPVCSVSSLPDSTGHSHLLPTLFNNIAQERVVRGTYLGSSCTQTAPLKVCTEATLLHSTVAMRHTTHVFNNVAQE